MITFSKTKNNSKKKKVTQMKKNITRKRKIGMRLKMMMMTTMLKDLKIQSTPILTRVVT
jgi:hypothetical protein